MMVLPRLAVLAGTLFVVWGLTGSAQAAPVSVCGPSWAVPGEYYVSGNFRGRDESTVIRLSRACRVHFEVPGVYSGGPVQPAGPCVGFSFKVQGAPDTFSAQWCEDYGVVPWNGRDIKVKVWQSRRQEEQRTVF